MYLSFTWKIGGPVTHTVYRKTRNEGKMKRGVTKTRVSHIHSNLEVAYKMRDFLYFHPMVSMFQNFQNLKNIRVGSNACF